jgi:hypothetical protein
MQQSLGNKWQHYFEIKCAKVLMPLFFKTEYPFKIKNSDIWTKGCAMNLTRMMQDKVKRKDINVAYVSNGSDIFG